MIANCVVVNVNCVRNEQRSDEKIKKETGEGENGSGEDVNMATQRIKALALAWLCQKLCARISLFYRIKSTSKQNCA